MAHAMPRHLCAFITDFFYRSAGSLLLQDLITVLMQDICSLTMDLCSGQSWLKRWDIISISAKKPKNEAFMSDTVIVEKIDQWAKITLNRPDRLNALNVEMHLALRAALENCECMRTVLITGSGSWFLRWSRSWRPQS